MNDKRTKIEFLDTLLATRRHYSRAEIMERLEKAFNIRLSRRTFYNYIKILRENGAPLEFRTEKTAFETTTYYFYDEKFNLQNTSINQYDILKIKSALTILQQLAHLPQMQDLEEIMLKMEQQLTDSNAADMPILFFEHRPSSTGFRWLRVLYHHIQAQEALKLQYQPFPQDEKDHTRWLDTGFEIIFHPYFLKGSKNLWYVFGYNQTKKCIENYALDRIQSVEKATNIFFKPNNSFNSATYFNNIVGVTRFNDQTLDTFLIRVNGIIAPYWHNRPLHQSQECVEQTPQYSVFSFQLFWNYEWQSLILSYGAHVEVLSPEWFRGEVKTIFEQALGLYRV